MFSVVCRVGLITLPEDEGEITIQVGTRHRDGRPIFNNCKCQWFNVEKGRRGLSLVCLEVKKFGKIFSGFYLDQRHCSVRIEE